MKADFSTPEALRFMWVEVWSQYVLYVRRYIQPECIPRAVRCRGFADLVIIQEGLVAFRKYQKETAKEFNAGRGSNQ